MWADLGFLIQDHLAPDLLTPGEQPDNGETAPFLPTVDLQKRLL